MNESIVDMVSNATLAKVAVFGGFITASSGFFLHWKIQQNLKNSEYCIKAINILKNHKPAVTLLGEPIKIGRINLDDRERNYCDGLKAQFEIPVKGPKQKGTLYFLAERALPADSWEVYEMELGLENEPSRRLRLLKNLKAGESNGIETK